MITRRIILFSWTAALAFISLSACRKAAVNRLDPDPEQIRNERFGEHGEFLRNADRIEIYSIAPDGLLENPVELSAKGQFHGYEIHGMIEINDPQEMETVWAQLHDRVYSQLGGFYAYCFSPRHAIRAFRGESVRDYLICFECFHLYVYLNPASDEYERIGLESSPGNLKMDELLDQAGIPRDKPPHDKGASHPQE
jgi:hypothetical protein